MPLFQPSNITPSSFAGVGGQTIDATDNIEITWQVNGNEAMTAYKIDIYDMSETRVGGLSAPDPIAPFYPNDEKGNPNYYAYIDANAWTSWGVENGNSYTLQITQYWGGLTDKAHSIEQFSQSAFIARIKPVIALKTSSGANIGEVTSLTQGFQAVYSTLSESGAIDWVRWQLYRGINSVSGVLLDDTGTVNTALLIYTADNLENGNTYTLRCTIQTEYGVQTTVEQSFNVSYDLETVEGNFTVSCKDKASNLLEWNAFTQTGANIPGVANGEISFENNNLVMSENSTVTWNTSNDKPLNLPTPWTMAWKGKAFVEYSASQSVYENPNDNSFTTGKYVASSHYLVGEYGGDVPQIYVYNVNGNNLDYIGDILLNLPNSVILENNIFNYGFSYDGKIVAVSGQDKSTTVSRAFVCIYSININTLNATQIGFYLFTGASFNNLSIPDDVHPVFTPNSKMLICASTDSSADFAPYFSVDNNTVTYLGNIKKSDSVRCGLMTGIAISSDSRILVARYRGLTGGPIDDDGIGVFEISNNLISYKQEIEGYLEWDMDWAQFSVDSKFLISSTKRTASELRSFNLFQVNNFDIVYKESAPTVGIGYNFTFLSNGLIIQQVEILEPYSMAMAVYAIENNSCVYKGKVKDLVPFNISKGFSVVQDQLIIMPHSRNMQIYGVSANTTNILNINNVYNINLNDTISIKYKQATFVTMSIGIPSYAWTENQYWFILSISLNSNSATFIHNGTTQTKTYDNSEFPQVPINSIKLLGEQTCEWLYVTNRDITITPAFTPTWDDYTQFLTNFPEGILQAGQIDVITPAIDIYRINLNTNEREKLYSVPSDINAFRDYGWTTIMPYKYIGYGRIGNKYTSQIKFLPERICRRQNAYTLLETMQDIECPNVYHVIGEWRFGTNISAGSISNNNTPNFLTNFTPYRLKQPIARLGCSGTLSALLSNVNNGQYADTIEQQKRLNNLSLSTNTFFLKDMKGNIYMVAISNSITQTIENKSAKLQVNISIPWEEIGSINGVSIVSTPNDKNWNNPKQN